MQYKFVNRKNESSDIRLGMSAGRQWGKRGMDILFSAAGLVLLSPVYAVLSLVLLLYWKACPFFLQERVGKGGRVFRICKFRTMAADAEAGGPQLTPVADGRLTPLGRFMRSHHLDELPQLWNVLKGDMTLVGYRPERPCFVERIMAEDNRYACLFDMRPGVTSEATLYNGYTDTMEKMLIRLNMDLQYMETATLGKDLLILFKTVAAVFYSEDKSEEKKSI